MAINLKHIIQFPFRLLGLGFYYCSHLFPRKEDQWLFGDGTGFNSNGKHLFLQTLENHPEIKAYWIGDKASSAKVRALGLPAYWRCSLKGLWLCLTSKYYIVSHTQGCINFWTSGGAKVVNLWHGLGWKACLWSNPFHQVFKKKERWANFCHLLFYPHLYYKPDLVLSTSPEMTERFFAPMFDVPTEKCVEDIYPRCQYMLQSKDVLLEKIKRYGKQEELDLLNLIGRFDKVVFYAPTYRDAQYDFFKESGIDFNDLNNEMKQRNWLFLVKCHPSTKIDYTRYTTFEHIVFADKNIDSYNIMPFTDMLVSDYSSIVFDYLLLQKKTIIFPFDKEKYLSTSRKMAFQYEELIEGLPIVASYPDLKTKSSTRNYRMTLMCQDTGKTLENL